MFIQILIVLTLIYGNGINSFQTKLAFLQLSCSVEPRFKEVTGVFEKLDDLARRVDALGDPGVKLPEDPVKIQAFCNE